MERVFRETSRTDSANVENSSGGRDSGNGSDSRDIEGSSDVVNLSKGADSRSDDCNSKSDGPRVSNGDEDLGTVASLASDIG